MESKNLNAELKPEKGKNVNRRLRDAGFIPAVIYSHGECDAIKIKQKDFFQLFRGQISESVIFDLKITDKKEDSEMMAFVKAYQIDPVTDEIVHLDLFKVTKGEKINTQVPIEIVGTPKGIKLGGMLEVSERVIEVECLPKDLPEKLVVDVTELLIDDSIHAKDIDLGEDVKLMSTPDAVIAAVHTVKIIEEEVAEEEEAEEVAEDASEEKTEE